MSRSFGTEEEYKKLLKHIDRVEVGKSIGRYQTVNVYRKEK